MTWRYEINRNNLRSYRINRGLALPADSAQVLHFALTANVVTYALTGGQFGYWHLFPAEGPWIAPPAWGEAHLTDGSTIYGLVPVGSQVHLELEPARGGCRETSAHRAGVNPGYNRYIPATGSLREREDSMLFRPLAVLGLVLERWLREENWFGATQVLVTSASSKTALGYAIRHEGRPALVALTSAQNREFVDRIGLYDCVFTYDHPPRLADDTLILDFTGNAELIGRLRGGCEGSMRIVHIGATHADRASLEGETVFFAPERIGQEIAAHGLETFERDRAAAISKFAARSVDWYVREYVDGPNAIADAFRNLLAGTVSPERLLIARPQGALA